MNQKEKNVLNDVLEIVENEKKYNKEEIKEIKSILTDVIENPIKITSAQKPSWETRTGLKSGYIIDVRRFIFEELEEDIKVFKENYNKVYSVQTQLMNERFIIAAYFKEHYLDCYFTTFRTNIETFVIDHNLNLNVMPIGVSDEEIKKIQKEIKNKRLEIITGVLT